MSENGLRQDSQDKTKKRETKSDRFVVYSRTKKAHSGVWNTQRARDTVKQMMHRSWKYFLGVGASREKKPFNHVTN